MELKRYQKEGCLAIWSNSKAHGELLACASPNTNNQSLFDLQILSVDLADPSKKLQSEGKSLYNSQYSCLAWGTFGEKEGTYPYGILFGGMQNGSFTLWNPAEMIGSHEDIAEAHIDDQNSFIYAEEAEQDGYPIMCAEWNALKNNYLAYGSSSLLILDIAKDISSPQIMKASSTNPHQGTHITSVSWNKQVPHILASAGSDGLVALYDIKTNKSIFKIKDNFSNNNQRQVKIAWSKHISTQIAVTLDDEKKNQLQIWDLRNQKGPIVVIDRGHTKGIHSMDWSELDNDLILMSSRDNIVNCWNIKQHDEPMSSRRSESSLLQVAWAKNLPSVYSITSVDGLAIYSLDDRNIHSYIPKWLKVPVNSVFNGNENLATFSQQRGKSMVQYNIKKQISKQLTAEIAVLQEFLENQTVENLKDAQGATGQFWKLIATKINQDGDSDIYDFLGLSKQKIIKEVQQYTGKKRDSFSANNLKSSKKNKQKTSKPDYIPVPVGEAADFFGSLSSEPLQQSFNKQQDDPEIQNVKYDMVPRNFNWDIGKQKLIKQNMLIGNYQGAIDAAIKCGRAAQALIIAYSIDQSMFNNTLKTFFTETTDKFISGILKHIAFKDTEELVRKYDLDRWRQCIALIFSLSSSQKRKNLLQILATRLEDEYPLSAEHQEAAIYSFILAEKFEKIVQVYEKRLNNEKLSLKQRKINLVIFGTRLLAIYSSLTVTVNVLTGFEKIVRQLALLCIQLGKKMIAYQLLTKFVPASSYKYINYLIQNTQQLANYRSSQSAPIINLPVMAAKKQDKQKKVKPKGKDTNEEVPTNIKPSKQPKLPVKTIDFDDTQNETQKKKPTNIPPPPPGPHNPKGPTGYNPQKSNPVVPIPVPVVIPQNKGKTPPPPPPPPGTAKKNKHYQKQEQDGEDQDQTPRNQPVNPPVHKKGNVPPPPPPPPSKTLLKSQVVQQQQNIKSITKAKQQTAKGRIPQLPRNLPPPPPPSIHHAVKQENTTVPPPKGVKGPPPPPPPRSSQKQDRQEEQEKQEKNPIVKGSKLNPPPPPPALVKNSNPLKVKQIQQDDEQDEEQQRPSQKIIPVPPSKKGSMPPPPPPPPVKAPVRVQSQKDDEDEGNTSFSQQGRRAPPPPPARKGNVPPPPPPGRR